MGQYGDALNCKGSTCAVIDLQLNVQPKKIDSF